MALAAPPPDDAIDNVVGERHLAGNILDYLNHLAAQADKEPLILSIKIHPLNITDGLAHEFAAHERMFLPCEKSAAHECADPHHPLENVIVRHELCALIAEMAAPLADATLAHHLLFILTIGKNLPAPYAADRLGICASFDIKRGMMRQRFAIERELAAPESEPRVACGMTLVCEPLESGYYRLPDDERHRSVSGLLMSDPLYAWTMRALMLYYLAIDDFGRLAAEEREQVVQLNKNMRFLFRLLAMAHAEMPYFVSLSGASPIAQPAITPFATPKIVFGRYASAGGALQPRNVEHRASLTLTEQSKAPSQHPAQHFLHLPGAEPHPE